ncbi:DUF4382 domain-containing protein [Draconibacterium sp. IB214405]|uniref:DUF4382 domain-containing protein n=1 Tax=Draconibacterium sp. IB214405 TaxID=3097352 RepID=UPI002A184F11|nr:DUF4382 domain-containing protein [Draconibacterium sp. IB214405]MDX8338287.1 DUF4382 domain-containing protein [Draconibacterium sp. IB214405]
MKEFGLALIVFVFGIFLMVSCNDDSETTTFAEGNGKVNVYLTDAPFPIGLVSQTIVTIDKVEIRKQENDTTEASFITILEEPFEVDLLTLANGITEQLASIELEAGTYDMMRMHVNESTVILTNGTEFELKIPSGSSSGLKIKIEPALTINSGETADVLLDFDVSKSFVAKGNWQGGKLNGFNFKPVVRCVLLDRAGRIEGMVSDTSNVALENSSVKLWMELNDVDADSLLTSAFTDEMGQYKLIGIPEGQYYMTAEIDSFITDTIWNVDVLKGESTQIDFVLTPEL